MAFTPKIVFSSPTSFSPANLSPAVWLSADSITDTQDATSFETWQDSSVNNRDATQSISTWRPKYYSNVINGNPAVYFVNDDFFTCNNSSGLTVGSVYLVISSLRESVNTISDWQGLISGEDNAPTYERVLSIQPNDETTHLRSIYSGTFRVDGTETQTLNKLDDWHVISFIYDTATALDAASSLQIGKEVLSGSRTHEGSMAEVIVFEETHVDADRINIQNYLNSKYNLNT